MPPVRELPASARCLIIGGGVGGTSLAYHLTSLGWSDVVLVERNQLTSGSTFHSAGLVGQLRGSVSLTKMMMYSVELYRRLGRESEFDPGWTECGSLRLASSDERMEELRRQSGWAKTFGLPLELISAAEAQELLPAHVHRRRGGRGVAAHGRLPRPGAAHLRAGRRRAPGRGHDPHLHPRDRHRRASTGAWRGVRTDRGDVECDTVVIAAGMFSAEVGRLAGVRIPVIPMSHEYLVTQPFRERDPANPLPTLRDPDLLVYFREEGGGLVMGGYERHSAPAFLPDGGAGVRRASRPTSTAACSRTTGTASRRSWPAPAAGFRRWRT